MTQAFQVAPIRLQYTVNGGTVQTGGIQVAAGAVIQLSLASLAGIGPVLWEIYTFPDGYATPTGWTLDSATGALQCLTANGAPPPPFTISSSQWGKWMPRATANNGRLNGLSNSGLVDQNSGFETVSPNLGLHDVAFDEASQFGPKGAAGSLQKSLRTLDTAVGGGGGGGGGSGLPPAPSGAGYYLLSVSSGGVDSWVTATANEIGAGFSVTLSLASGGAGPFELGATWTPTFTASPATNAGTVNTCSIHDSLGNSSSVSASNPLSAPSGGGTYTLTSPGSVSVFVQESQTSPPVTANSNSVGASWLARSFYWVDGANTATSATASGNNATMSDSATATGTLATIGAGYTFPSMSPANQYIGLMTPHTSVPHTFTAAGFAFPVAAPVTFTFVNQDGVSVSMDIYYSTSKLNASFLVQVAS